MSFVVVLSVVFIISRICALVIFANSFLNSFSRTASWLRLVLGMKFDSAFILISVSVMG